MQFDIKSYLNRISALCETISCSGGRTVYGERIISGVCYIFSPYCYGGRTYFSFNACANEGIERL